MRGGGEIQAREVRGKAKAGAEAGKRNTYKDYFDHREPAARIPSHRLLAILRGERDGFLASDLVIDDRALARSLAKSWGVPPCEGTASGRPEGDFGTISSLAVMLRGQCCSKRRAAAIGYSARSASDA